MNNDFRPTPTYSAACAPKGDSVILEVLALAARPDVISFAGGLPSPEGFPVKEIAKAAQWVLDNHAARALQYSACQGVPELREVIARRETEKGAPTSPDEVLVVSGSQQALDMMGRLFVDAGSKVLVESPTYMGALQAFALNSPKFVELPCDEEGLNPDLITREMVEGARFAYVMPTFQNPTGLTISEERRRKLAEKAREFDFWLVEDNPYGELWYEDEPAPSLRAFAPERTITLGTMSKVLAPGFRLGYILAPKHVLDACMELKQAMDLHTSTFTQLICARVLSEGLFKDHLPMVRALYRRQARAMLDAMEREMPQHPELSWTKPEGGMFLWMKLPKHIDAAELMKAVLATDVPVGFVPGFAFFANDPKPANYLRLSFVTVPVELINAGVKSLADTLRKFL